MKALVISVGTGTRPTQEAVESLAKAIVFSIKNHNPDRIFFIVSPESLNTTFPVIAENIKTRNYEIIQIQNPDDIQKTYETIQEKLEQITKKFDQITIDYTSGTKAMTGALTILGTIYEVQTLSYIAGERVGGIVQTGTEKLNIVQPYFATLEQKLKTATHFFNKNQFNATIGILSQIEKKTTAPHIICRTTALKKLAKAYSLWDKFQHEKAFQMLSKIRMEQLSRNKRFLGELLRANEPMQYYIADLINNARRRGTDEGRYDDAVARLYRTIELVAQRELSTKYNTHTSAIEPTDLPEELKKKWNITTTTQQIQISLQKAYELLHAKNDPLGKRFIQDKKLNDLLSKRNVSILAHALTPVRSETYTELCEKTIQYASTVIDNLNRFLIDSKFIKWNN